MSTIAKPDYWSLLGLTPDCNPNDLKKAFRREARKWHPDLNGNDLIAEERFKLVNEAYEVLSDPQKRLNWERQSNPNYDIDIQFIEGFPTFSEYLNIVFESEIQDNFNEMVSNTYQEEIQYNRESSWPTTSPSSPPPIPLSEDLETLVNLNPEQALLGARVELDLPDGKIVEIQTPPFAGDGWRLRLSGVASGGRDHFLQLRVITDEGLRIDGLKVFYRLELFPPEAVLGCAIEVPTLDGAVTLQVPPKSSSGRLLRLRGRGMEHEGVRGDQYVEIFVVIPDDLSDSETRLYSRLQDLSLDQ